MGVVAGVTLGLGLHRYQLLQAALSGQPPWGISRLHLGREEKRKSVSDVKLKRGSNGKHEENAHMKVPEGLSGRVGCGSQSSPRSRPAAAVLPGRSLFPFRDIP